MPKTLRIFALGGNEISPTGKVDLKTNKIIVPDLPSQWQRTAKTCKLLADIISRDKDNYHIITHGNGPQVGNILLRVEHSRSIIHPIPLDVCGADSQGGIGYMIGQQAQNAFKELHMNILVVESLNQVVVSKDDSAFQDPTKFIGPAFTKEDAETKAQLDGWDIKMYKLDDEGREIWRRVVPSPKPLDVVELDLIDLKMRNGIIPIAVGGGGIPVIEVEEQMNVIEMKYDVKYKKKKTKTPYKFYRGVEAVIDKDLSSALLGKLLIEKAKKNGEEFIAEFIILTDEDGAKLNYQTPEQIDLRMLTLSEAEKLMGEGHFPEGSMGPKFEACINFLKGGGQKACISKVSLLEKTLKGEAGTTIVPN